MTNAAGLATATAFTANGAAGTFQVVASVPGLTSATFSVTNVLATAATAVASPANGTPQSAAVNTTFTTALGVLVKDATGTVIVGIPATFTINPVGGATACSPVAHDAYGEHECLGHRDRPGGHGERCGWDLYRVRSRRSLSHLLQLSNTAVPERSSRPPVTISSRFLTLPSN